MTEIWILTSCFPYEPGEQFLETEIQHWAELGQENVTLIPLRAIGMLREVPSGISVDLSLTTSGRTAKLYSLIKAFFSPWFLQELLWLKQHKRLSLSTVYSAWRTLASIFLKYKVLKQRIRETGDSVIIGYSYWFDVSAYALALLRREGVVNYLVTRAHRFDVYENRRTGQYMPLKRQFAKDFDKVLAISTEGRSYLHANYDIPDNCLEVARLGVVVSDKLSLPSHVNMINVLSVSFCVPVKRIDRIIDGIALAARSLGRETLINWTHIGDGEMKESLEAKAAQTFSCFNNIQFQFVGHYSNSDVLHHYETNNVDVFINTSESEGIPVSIMEAMSFGVPVIAPSVGGISEIVTQENGWLLSDNPTNEEIAEAICSTEHYKCKETRKAARQTILLDYNAQKNYSAFIHTLRIQG